MIFSTVSELVDKAILADQPQSEELSKEAQAEDQVDSAEVINDINTALEEAGYGDMEKRASQLGMAKLLVALDILGNVSD